MTEGTGTRTGKDASSSRFAFGKSSSAASTQRAGPRFSIAQRLGSKATGGKAENSSSPHSNTFEQPSSVSSGDQSDVSAAATSSTTSLQSSGGSGDAAAQGRCRRRFADTRELDVLKSELAAERAAERSRARFAPPGSTPESARGLSDSSTESPYGSAAASQTKLSRGNGFSQSRSSLVPDGGAFDASLGNSSSAYQNVFGLPEGMFIGLGESRYPGVRTRRDFDLVPEMDMPFPRATGPTTGSAVPGVPPGFGPAGRRPTAMRSPAQQAASPSRLPSLHESPVLNAEESMDSEAPSSLAEVDVNTGGGVVATPSPAPVAAPSPAPASAPSPAPASAPSPAPASASSPAPAADPAAARSAPAAPAEPPSEVPAPTAAEPTASLMAPPGDSAITPSATEQDLSRAPSNATAVGAPSSEGAATTVQRTHSTGETIRPTRPEVAERIPSPAEESPSMRSTVDLPPTRPSEAEQRPPQKSLYSLKGASTSFVSLFSGKKERNKEEKGSVPREFKQGRQGIKGFFSRMQPGRGDKKPAQTSARPGAQGGTPTGPAANPGAPPAGKRPSMPASVLLGNPSKLPPKPSGLSANPPSARPKTTAPSTNGPSSVPAGAVAAPADAPSAPASGAAPGPTGEAPSVPASDVAGSAASAPVAAASYAPVGSVQEAQSGEAYAANMPTIRAADPSSHAEASMNPRASSTAYGVGMAYAPGDAVYDAAYADYSGTDTEGAAPALTSTYGTPPATATDTDNTHATEAAYSTTSHPAPAMGDAAPAYGTAQYTETGPAAPVEPAVAYSTAQTPAAGGAFAGPAYYYQAPQAAAPAMGSMDVPQPDTTYAPASGTAQGTNPFTAADSSVPTIRSVGRARSPEERARGSLAGTEPVSSVPSRPPALPLPDTDLPGLSFRDMFDATEQMQTIGTHGAAPALRSTAAAPVAPPRDDSPQLDVPVERASTPFSEAMARLSFDWAKGPRQPSA